MFKQTLVIILITAVIVYFAHQFGVIFGALGHFQGWVAHQITELAPRAKWIKAASDIITLVLIPIIVALIPAFIYWIIEKSEMPKLRELMGILWIILLLVFVLHRK